MTAERVVVAIPCLLTGGTEMQTLASVRALRDAGYGVTVCCYFNHEESVVGDFRDAGAEVVTLGLERAMPPWQLVARLRSQFRRLRPDAVHVQYMAPGLLPILAARLAGVPNVVATVHQPATPHGWRARILLRLGASLCRKFICVSQAAETSWFGDSAILDPDSPDSLRRRHVTIYNAVDIARIDRIVSSPDRERLRHELNLDGSTVIGTVSRLSQEKGIDTLLTAFAEVHARLSSAVLLVVGDGVERPALEALAERLGVRDAVLWTGRQPWEEAMRYLSVMDVVVVPSRFEGFGLTAAEAMACGKPVVASNVDGLREVVVDAVTGTLVNCDDAHEMANAVMEILNDPCKHREMGTSGRQRVERLFSCHAFAQKYRQLYLTLDRVN